MHDIVSLVRHETKPEYSSGTCCAETMYASDGCVNRQWLKTESHLENLSSEHSIGKHLLKKEQTGLIICVRKLTLPIFHSIQIQFATWLAAFTQRW